MLTALAGDTGDEVRPSDNGSEVNMMSGLIFALTDLPIDTDIRWRINAYNTDSDLEASGPIGVCHDVPINLGGVEVKQHIFVVEHSNADLILGRPWERAVRANYINEDDGSYTVRIKSPDGWPVPKSLTDARGFIGIFVYYRIFILGFAIIAFPIFALFRKGKHFVWTDECQMAMDTLKIKITEACVLITLDFSASALSIALHVDASTKIGWGEVLSQLREDGQLHPARFESGIWSDAERKYDALKLAPVKPRKLYLHIIISDTHFAAINTL